MRKDFEINEKQKHPSRHVVNTKLPPKGLEFQPTSDIEKEENRAMRLIEAGNPKEGKSILLRLYKQGDYWAGNTLAYGMQSGWFGRREYKRAIAIFQDCVNHDDCGAAMNNLAYSYASGIGIEQDTALAITWYEKAIEAGYHDAKTNLAIELLNAPEGLRDYSRAFALCTGPDMEEDAEAFNTLGLIYEYGLGVPQDLHKAYAKFKRAVEIGGCPMAEYNLSRYKVKGK